MGEPEAAARVLHEPEARRPALLRAHGRAGAGAADARHDDLAAGRSGHAAEPLGEVPLYAGGRAPPRPRLPDRGRLPVHGSALSTPFRPHGRRHGAGAVLRLARLTRCCGTASRSHTYTPRLGRLLSEARGIHDYERLPLKK